jgi:hypothetical protein
MHSRHTKARCRDQSWRTADSGRSPNTVSTMSNSQNTPSRSETVNGHRYRRPNAMVYLNPDGLPIAFRRVRVLQPGSFVGACRFQIVSPKGVSPLPKSTLSAYRDRCSPLN